MSDSALIVTCDGACCPNPGQMAAGFVVRRSGLVVLEKGEALGPGTNNIAEITAVALALEAIDKTSGILIRSDSQYVINCTVGNWARKKNREAWERFDKALKRHRKIRFEWVRGHNGDPDNERADRLAAEALAAIAYAAYGGTLLFDHEAKERWGDDGR